MTLGYWVWREPSKHEARTVLGYLGEHGGYALDNDAFGRRLLDFAFKCDRQNLGLLALGFPGYCSAVWSYKNDDFGLARLQAVAQAVTPASE